MRHTRNMRAVLAVTAACLISHYWYSDFYYALHFIMRRSSLTTVGVETWDSAWNAAREVCFAWLVPDRSGLLLVHVVLVQRVQADPQSSQSCVPHPS